MEMLSTNQRSFFGRRSSLRRERLDCRTNFNLDGAIPLTDYNGYQPTIPGFTRVRSSPLGRTGHGSSTHTPNNVSQSLVQRDHDRSRPSKYRHRNELPLWPPKLALATRSRITGTACNNRAAYLDLFAGFRSNSLRKVPQQLKLTKVK